MVMVFVRSPQQRDENSRQEEQGDGRARRDCSQVGSLRRGGAGAQRAKDVPSYWSGAGAEGVRAWSDGEVADWKWEGGARNLENVPKIRYG